MTVYVKKQAQILVRVSTILRNETLKWSVKAVSFDMASRVNTVEVS